MSNPTYGSIIFPVGLAGNHLRWLLYLDPCFPSLTDDHDINSKLNFIQKNIYGPERTWNQWLHIEWRYRMQLDRTLTIKHDCWDWENSTDNKELYLSIDDYQKPLLHYYHINLGLNNNTPESFLNRLEKWINEFEFIKKRIT